MNQTMESLFSLRDLLSKAKHLLLYQTPWFVLQDEWNASIKIALYKNTYHEGEYK